MYGIIIGSDLVDNHTVCATYNFECNELINCSGFMSTPNQSTSCLKKRANCFSKGIVLAHYR